MKRGMPANCRARPTTFSHSSPLNLVALWRTLSAAALIFQPVIGASISVNASLIALRYCSSREARCSKPFFSLCAGLNRNHALLPQLLDDSHYLSDSFAPDKTDINHVLNKMSSTPFVLVNPRPFWILFARHFAVLPHTMSEGL
jgi:hypothetical protein